MNDIVRGKRDKNDEKFFLFSGHDTNVGNIWRYLRPVNFMQNDLSGKKKYI